MAQKDLILPKMGESVAEATIIKWFIEEGDHIEEDEAIVEIATDKVDSEMPSPFEGVLIKKNFQEGDVAKVGDVIGIISTEGGDNDQPDVSGVAEVAEEPVTPPAISENVPQNDVQPVQAQANMPAKAESGKFYSPLVRNMAKKEGISFEDLEAIKGTGANGRVTKKDLLQHLENGGSKLENGSKAVDVTPQKQAPAKETIIQKEEPVKAPDIIIGDGDEIIEMDRMRKLIADHMVMSKKISPHVTSFVEADVTNIVVWRNRVKEEFQKKYGEKITFTPIFIEAVAKALRDFPLVNSSLDGEKIIVKKNINIGMATALPSGNLIVPVIKKADQLNLMGLTKEVNGLANRARANQLNPEEIQGGTYTVTNVGSFGNVMGTPIINQPQAAILALGAIRKKPTVIETSFGDTIGVRHMMFLSHAYDHRIIDGALGGSFVKKVAEYLEEFDVNREI